MKEEKIKAELIYLREELLKMKSYLHERDGLVPSYVSGRVSYCVVNMYEGIQRISKILKEKDEEKNI